MKQIFRLAWLLGALFVAAVSAAQATVIDDKIAALLATLDKQTYEAHRKCYGWQQGIYALLQRLRPLIEKSDLAAFDKMAVLYSKDYLYGPTDLFFSERKLPFDTSGGDKAWGQGELEWGAQAILPPEQQYAYFQQYGYGKNPKGCDEVETRIGPVRDKIWRYEFDRDLYGKDYVPQT